MACADAKIAGMCQKILSVEPAMWTFVRVVGVEPTNNDGERSVIVKKDVAFSCCVLSLFPSVRQG
jgi:hypothetical protein